MLKLFGANMKYFIIATIVVAAIIGYSSYRIEVNEGKARTACEINEGRYMWGDCYMRVEPGSKYWELVD